MTAIIFVFVVFIVVQFYDWKCRRKESKQKMEKVIKGKITSFSNSKDDFKPRD